MHTITAISDMHITQLVT